MKIKKWLCTRPGVVSELLNSGIDCTPTSNPFNADRLAWSVELTKDAALIVSKYYQDNGAEVPKLVREALEGAAV